MLPSYTPVISVLIFRTWLCYAAILRKRAQHSWAQGGNPLELQESSSLAPQHTCGRDGWKFAWSHFLLSSLADWKQKGCFLLFAALQFTSLCTTIPWPQLLWGSGFEVPLAFTYRASKSAPMPNVLSVNTLWGWAGQLNSKRGKGINHNISKVELQLLTDFFL